MTLNLSLIIKVTTYVGRFKQNIHCRLGVKLSCLFVFLPASLCPCLSVCLSVSVCLSLSVSFCLLALLIERNGNASEGVCWGGGGGREMGIIFTRQTADSTQGQHSHRGESPNRFSDSAARTRANSAAICQEPCGTCEPHSSLPKYQSPGQKHCGGLLQSKCTQARAQVYLWPR